MWIALLSCNVFRGVNRGAGHPSRLWVALFSSNAVGEAIRGPGPPSRSLRRRISRRLKAANKPILNKFLFEKAISEVPPRFTPEELSNVMTLIDDPLVCFEIFNWASKQHRFRHDVSTYHITIKKLGAVKMYEEMDYVVNQVLALPSVGTEPLFNTMIYYFIRAYKLIRAVNIYNHMRDIRKLDCRPSIRTYNILFPALLDRGKNPYINYKYMDAMSRLFKQMVEEGIEPDIHSLNSMIRGYVLSLHLNDALRIFHQMGVVYTCVPNSFTYDCLIHGLCAQERTNNAQELCSQMKDKGFIPSSKSYNSIINSLALNGEVDCAVDYFREMAANKRSADLITYNTLIEEICRQKSYEDGMQFLKELHDKGLVDEHTYRQLLSSRTEEQEQGDPYRRRRRFR